MKLGLVDFHGFIIMLSTVTILLKILYKRQLLMIVFSTIIGMILAGVIELIVGALITFIFRVPTAELLESNGFRLLGIILSKMLFLLVVECIISKNRYIMKIREDHLYVLCLIALFNIIIIFMAFEVYSNVDNLVGNKVIYVIEIGLAAIVFSYLVLIIVKKITQLNQNEWIWKIREKEYQNHIFYIKNMEDMMMTMKSQRHEFNNFINALYGLLYQEKYDEAKSYILSLTEEVAVVNEMVSNPNPVITALINIKKIKAEQCKTVLNSQVSLTKKILLENLDLTIILGNLLDNAIEASTKIDENKRNIDLEIFSKGCNLIICISNYKNSKEFFQWSRRFTSKNNKEEHGFGLYNVAQIVNKNQGSIRIEDQEYVFKVIIHLPIK
ncbi:sensor histidine kinase [Alkaliphilus hydrothermalis]|nr:GHKL domain-containing protein [Alkaliphilus hydrothermalis]